MGLLNLLFLSQVAFFTTQDFSPREIEDGYIGIRVKYAQLKKGLSVDDHLARYVPAKKAPGVGFEPTRPEGHGLSSGISRPAH
jgi:hypothetical protein